MAMYVKQGEALGQLDAGPITATMPDGAASPTGIPFAKLFLVSVAAGVTVWLITKLLERR